MRFLVFLFVCGAMGLAGLGQPTNSAPAADSPEKSPGGILQLFDGTSLHGQLRAISRENGVTWAHPAAQDPMVFRPDNIASVRFEESKPAAPDFQPTCRFRFSNGDEIIGHLSSIVGRTAELETWFGGRLKTPQEALKGIIFSAKGFKLLYEGPTGPEGWKIGRNPRTWQYHDGMFFAQGADILGRNFGLSGSSSLEFDLAWTSTFSLSITLYSQVVDRFDYSSSAYIVYLNPGMVSIQRLQAGAGAIMLGQSERISALLKKNKCRFEIRCNKEDATIAVYADGSLVQRWKDNAGFVAKGPGVVFYSQMEGPALKLGNIKVSEWDGRAEPEPMTNLPPNEDVVFLANRDKVVGKIEGLQGGKLSVLTKQLPLTIPLDRVTQILLAQKQPEKEVLKPWEVRAWFRGGETVSFSLDTWNGQQVAGTSSNFGAVSFKPNAIRQLQFNLDRSPPPEDAGEDLGDVFPELDQ